MGTVESRVLHSSVAAVNVSAQVKVTEYHPERHGVPIIGDIDVEISLTNPNRRIEQQLDVDKMADFFVEV